MRNTKRLVRRGPAIALALVALLGVSWSGGGASTPLVPYVVLTGADSQVAAREYMRIFDERAWTDVWLRHAGYEGRGPYSRFYNRAEVPVVDFERCMVLAIFQGSGRNSTGLAAVDVSETDDELSFRYDVKQYQTMGDWDPATPYGFFILPRSHKQLVVEEDVQLLAVGKRIWKERARFEALPAPTH